MNFFASFTSNNNNNNNNNKTIEPSSSTTISSSAKQQQQQQGGQHQTSFDIEEATPPVSSQRTDQSRLRRSTIQQHLPGVIEDNNNIIQSDNNNINNNSYEEDNINNTPTKSTTNKKQVLTKPPNSANFGALPLTLNQVSTHGNTTITAATIHAVVTGGVTNSSSSNSSNKKVPEPKLIHPILRKIPLQFRFAFYGFISNLLFMIAYNEAVAIFVQYVSASTIYSIVYLIYIPLGHLAANLLVFGWPEHYMQSLISNFPIGLTAIAIGSLLTAYLDRIHFNQSIEEYIYDNWTFQKMPDQRKEYVNEKSEFYSSLVVLVVTSIWTYILSVWVNSQPTKSEKKEL